MPVTLVAQTEAMNGDTLWSVCQLQNGKHVAVAQTSAEQVVGAVEPRSRDLDGIRLRAGAETHTARGMISR